MRAFILLCFVAGAFAQYDYGSGVSGGISGGSLGSGGFGGPSSGGVGGPSSGGFGAPSYSGYNKEFYTFVAPEGEFDDPNAAQKIASMLKKNIRVVFIKNPENKAYEDAVLALAKQAAEQKTHVYVLNKQHDIGDLANKFNAIRNSANAKPEVHFVKYRTPEDAANAQRTIQGQYDALDGPSQNYNGGVAPVLNFASQSPHFSAGHGGVQAPQYSAGHGGVQAPQSIYLPSSVFRRFRTVRRV